MVLTTAHLALGEFQPNDWQAVWRYQNQPDYLRLYPGTERTPEDVQEFVSRFIAWQAELRG